MKKRRPWKYLAAALPLALGCVLTAPVTFTPAAAIVCAEPTTAEEWCEQGEATQFASFDQNGSWLPQGDFEADYRAAIPYFERALQLDPHCVRAYLGLGNSYMGMMQQDKAAQMFDAAIQIDPRSSQAYAMRADVFFDEQRTDKVIEYCNKAIALDPSNSTAYDLRTVAYEMQGQYDAALQDRNTVIRLREGKPHFAYEYISRAGLYQRMGRYNDALKDMDTAVGLDPSDAGIYESRAGLLLWMKLYDRAISDARKANELQPGRGDYIIRYVRDMRKAEDLGVRPPAGFDAPVGIGSGAVDEVRQYEKTILQLVNAERKKKGRKPLKINGELAVAASVRADEIQQDYSHTRPNGESYFTVMNSGDYALAENIAKGPKTPENVVKAWMDDPESRVNLLSASFTELGLGHRAANGSDYWVLLVRAEME
ncbi:CAP domain-containing protein [uncultured Selenomonas sp.]|uniref:CAP domain-containing protein n=1 Tax=uncultured Selenomonas sp. TaxID=159275 RepID=UPI0025E3E040|nr:CAP domain-containing protein [uncultured Selenomonas sp.]